MQQPTIKKIRLAPPLSLDVESKSGFYRNRNKTNFFCPGMAFRLYGLNARDEALKYVDGHEYELAVSKFTAAAELFLQARRRESDSRMKENYYKLSLDCIERAEALKTRVAQQKAQSIPSAPEAPAYFSGHGLSSPNSLTAPEPEPFRQKAHSPRRMSHNPTPQIENYPEYPTYPTAPPAEPAQHLPSHANVDPIQNAISATVLVQFKTSAGSGAIINRSGLIVTNHHVIRECQSNSNIIIAVTPMDQQNSAARPKYVALLVMADPVLDVAVLRIRCCLDGSPLSSDPIQSHIEIGDSDELKIGHDVAAIGYPGVGGNAVTYTRGTVSGFLPAEKFIKTDAEVNPGNSGGPAINNAGKLVGIVTANSTGSEKDPSQATGKLGLIRPINLLKPLISSSF